MKKIFLDMQKNRRWLVDNGRDNEDRFELQLRQTSYLKIPKDDIPLSVLRKLKEYVLTKTEIEDGEFLLSELSDIHSGVSFDFLRHSFVREPFGSQMAPDFLVFEGDRIIPVEIKKSNLKKPKLNNSYFHAGYVYIFSNKDDITFFLGESIVSGEFYELVQKYKEKFRRLQEEMDRDFGDLEVEANPFGVTMYPRVNFIFKKLHDHVKSDFFDGGRIDRENMVVEFLAATAETISINGGDVRGW